MKNTKKELTCQSKNVKASFTRSKITKYSGLNTVAKCMNRYYIKWNYFGFLYSLWWWLHRAED